MNTKYTIKNFRVFDEKGVTVDIKPLTILTGCNSSGKSSIVKSMVLLNTYIESLQEYYKAFNRINLLKHKLDFTKDSTITLGNFNRVRHNNSKEKTITFQYEVHSLLLCEDVIVSLVFGAEENDALNNGYLLEITIMKLSGDCIYSSSKENPCQADYNQIVPNFYRFVKGQYLVEVQNEQASNRRGLYGTLTEDEFHKHLEQLPTEWREIEEKKEAYYKKANEAIEWYRSSFVSIYGEDSLPDIEKWTKRHGKNHNLLASGFSDKKEKSLIEKWANCNIDIIDISNRWNTLFYFPLLEKLFNLDKASFKDALLAMLIDVTCEKEVLYAIDKISDDFGNSDCSTFGEYFKEKEFDFLVFTMNIGKKHVPFIHGTDFFHVDDIYHVDNYLTWTKRIFGPGFVKTPTGNLESTIGIGEYDEWKQYPVNFYLLYSVLMNLNNMIDLSESSFYYIDNYSKKKQYPDFRHHMFEMFTDYASMVMREVVTSAIPQNLSYIGTSLVNVRRDYSLDVNDSFTNLIKRYFEALRSYNNSKENNGLGTESFISKWIRMLGIGYAVDIELINSGSSFMVRLYKDENDKTGNILAEEGYGITQIITLLIRIETAILESKENVDAVEDEHINSSYLGTTIAIEEPEVHLHPKFQSLLADMFVDAYKNYNVHFIIETHSEYLIRKLQMIVAKKEVQNTDISVLYVYDKDNRPDSEPQVKRIGISDKGMLLDRFGEGFYDEADELSMNLLMQQRIHD